MISKYSKNQIKQILHILTNGNEIISIYRIQKSAVPFEFNLCRYTFFFTLDESLRLNGMYPISAFLENSYTRNLTFDFSLNSESR